MQLGRVIEHNIGALRIIPGPCAEGICRAALNCPEQTATPGHSEAHVVPCAKHDLQWFGQDSSQRNQPWVLRARAEGIPEGGDWASAGDPDPGSSGGDIDSMAANTELPFLTSDFNDAAAGTADVMGGNVVNLNAPPPPPGWAFAPLQTLRCVDKHKGLHLCQRLLLVQIAALNCTSIALA